MKTRPVEIDTAETPTPADIEAATGKNPDPTGHFAAGRTHFHAGTEEFLACLASQPPGPVES